VPDKVDGGQDSFEPEEELPPGFRRVVKPPLIPRSEWKESWPGSTLDWTTPDIPIQLYVELPFWLMISDGTFAVKNGEATHHITVVHDCEEIHRSVRLLKNRFSAVFIARPGEAIPVEIQRLIDGSADGCSVHVHRTTLIIETKLLPSVLEKVRGGGLERLHAYNYLWALAVGHLPFVNALITAYRRAGNDPFVQEVTEATVPIWFARHGDFFLRFSVYPYADHEDRPGSPTHEGTIVPAALATSDEMTEYLAKPAIPGETILLDAWYFFYSGRYGDSVRGLVSALEVLLEAKYSEALSGYPVLIACNLRYLNGTTFFDASGLNNLSMR